MLCLVKWNRSGLLVSQLILKFGDVATDALSRLHSQELLVLAVSSISINLMIEIQKSWEEDDESKHLISELKQQTLPHSPCMWSDEKLIRRGRLVWETTLNYKGGLQDYSIKKDWGTFRDTGHCRDSKIFFRDGMKKQVRFIRECDMSKVQI